MAKTLANNQLTLSSTSGATALNMNVAIEENKISEGQHLNNKQIDENISLENANYLQSLEENKMKVKENTSSIEDKTPNFEVESIELASPQLFSDETENSSMNDENIEKKEEMTMFESLNSNERLETAKEEKEPEMFSDSETDEDFEIPAFLRRQKN